MDTAIKRPGFFGVFEGPEACGKSTQIRLLTNRLRQEGFATEQYREPGGTENGDLFRRIVLDLERSMNKTTEFLLFAAARSELQDVLKRDMEANKAVFYDRYWSSTIAYQGWGRGVDIPGFIVPVHTGMKCVVPDVTIFIDLPYDDAQKRLKGRGGASDRFEHEEREYHERVLAGYRDLVNYPQYFGKVVTINATAPGTQSVEEIHESVYQTVRSMIQIPTTEEIKAYS
jgi:dTMP kinase